MNKKIVITFTITVIIIFAGAVGMIYCLPSKQAEVVIHSQLTKIACYDSLVKIADAKSLTVFENSGYAKDKNNVYFPRDAVCSINCYCTNFVIIGADLFTFSVLNHGYAKDKNSAYFKGEKIIGADLSSFKIIESSSSSFFAAKDKENVFVQNTKISKADPDTFEYLNEREIYVWMKDKNYVWTMLRNDPDSIELIEGADSETFKLIPTLTSQNVSGNEHYALDKNHAYFLNKIIEESDPKTFQPLSIFISKDKNNAYAAEEKIAGVDVATFEVIDSHYSKDKNHVYYLKNILENVDPKTYKSKP